MAPTIVAPDARYRPVTLAEPAPHGYLYVAASVAPPVGPPFPVPNARRSALLSRLKALAADLEGSPSVVRATVFQGALLPPPSTALESLPAGAIPGLTPSPPSDPGPVAAAAGPFRADVVVLVTAASPSALPGVRDSPAFRSLIDAVGAVAPGAFRVVAARCAKRIADVEPSPRGVFIFNHFTTEDPAPGLALWDHVAGWYAKETGLANSLVMVPLEPAPWAFVNHARWDCGLGTLARRQFAKASFRTFVLANLRAGGIVASPALYRLA